MGIVMKNEFILYSQNLLKLVAVSALIGLLGLTMLPKGPNQVPLVLAYNASSSR